MSRVPLSCRIRPACEAAPWVVDEVRKLEAELTEARAAVAELIEADVALDAIDAELPCAPEDMPDPVAYIRRRDAAYKRRAAALARVQGGAA